MAEKEEDPNHSVSGLKNNCNTAGGPVSPKSPEDETSESPVPEYAQDLKSVLVTSVLNLEKLDVDLYR